MLRPVLCLLAVGLVASCAPCRSPGPGRPPACCPREPSTIPVKQTRSPWTLALYIAADSEVGCHLVQVLEALAQAPHSDQVQVVAFVDQSPVMCSDGLELPDGVPILNVPAWTGGRVLRLWQGQLQELPWSGAPEPASDDPRTLRAFLDVVREYAPSDKLALWTFSHGQPCLGVCPDDTSPRARDGGPDSGLLTFSEMRSALREAGFGPHGLELLVLVGCSVGSAEMLHLLAPAARWIVASECPTEVFSISYARVLEQLGREPDMDGGALGEFIAKTHEAPQGVSCERERLGAGIGCFDGVAWGAVSGALGGWMDLVRTRLSNPATSRVTARALLCARGRARGFNCGGAPCVTGAPEPVDCSCGMRDLLMLVESLPDFLPGDAALVGACAGLGRAIRSATRCLVTSSMDRDVGGVSIFLPCSTQHVAAYETAPFATDYGWSEIIESALAKADCTCATAPEPSAPEFNLVSGQTGNVYRVTGWSPKASVPVHAAWLVLRRAGASAHAGMLVAAPLTVRQPTELDPVTRIEGLWGGTVLALESGHVGVPATPLIAEAIRGGPHGSGHTELVARLTWQPSDVCRGCEGEVRATIHASPLEFGPGQPWMGTLVRIERSHGDRQHVVPLSIGDTLMLGLPDQATWMRNGLTPVFTVPNGRHPQTAQSALLPHLQDMEAGILTMTTTGTVRITFAAGGPITPP